MKQYLVFTDAGRYYVKAHSRYNALLVFWQYAHDKRQEGNLGPMPFLENVREVPYFANSADNQIVVPLPLPPALAGALPTPTGAIPSPIG